MKTKKIADNSLPEEIYQSDKLMIAKIVGTGLGLLLLGFIINFPLNETVETLVINEIKKNKACPISYQKLKTELFFPKVLLKNPIIDGRCFGRAGKSLKLQSMNVSFLGPSFIPFGAKLNAKIKGMNSKINAYPSIGMGSMKVKIEDSVIHSKLINAIIDKFIKINGKFKTEALIGLEGKVLDDADIKITSTDFKVPAQSIMGLLNIKQLNIGSFSLVAKMAKKGVLEVLKLEIGSSSSPFILRLKGKINVSKKNFNYSSVELIGEMKIDKDKAQDLYSPLNLFWQLSSQPKTPSGYWKIRFQGPINKIRKPQFLE